MLAVISQKGPFSDDCAEGLHKDDIKNKTRPNLTTHRVLPTHHQS